MSKFGIQKVANIYRLSILFMVAAVALTPMYVGFAEMQATPVVEPTPSPEPTPTEIAPATPDHLDEDRTEPSSIDPAVFPIDSVNSLSGCTQSSETISPSFPVYVECTLTLRGTDLLGGALAVVHGRVDRESLPSGYSAAISMVPKSLGNGSDLNPGNGSGFAWASMGLRLLGSEGTQTVTIEISVTSAAIPGEQNDLTFESCRATVGGSRSCLTGNNKQGGSVTVSVRVPPVDLVEGQHFDFTCRPPRPDSISLGETAMFDCFVTASAIGTRQIRVDHIDISLASEGAWDITAVDPDNEDEPIGVGQGRHIVQDSVPMYTGRQFAFQIQLMPTGCVAVGQENGISVSPGITPLHDGQRAGDTVPTEPLSLGPVVNPPSVTHSAIVKSVDDPNDPFDYSLVAPIENIEASFTLDSSVGGCVLNPDTDLYEPYEVTTFVTMSEFTWVESELSNEQPPAGSDVPFLARNWHGDSDADDDMQVTVVEIENTTISDDEQNATPLLITSSDTGAVKSVEHTINLEYTIPANTPVGTYTSTITVTTSAGPD